MCRFSRIMRRFDWRSNASFELYLSSSHIGFAICRARNRERVTYKTAKDVLSECVYESIPVLAVHIRSRIRFSIQLYVSAISRPQSTGEVVNH